MAEPLRTIAEAAEFLGIPRTTLRDRVTARNVPHTRIGRHVRFSEAHLAAIIAAGEQPVIQPPTQIRVAAARRVSRMETTPPTPPPPSGPTTPPPPSGPKSRVA